MDFSLRDARREMEKSEHEKEGAGGALSQK